VTVRTMSVLVAACHSAACRPPTSGGTGGSSPQSSAHGPSTVAGDPLFQTLTTPFHSPTAFTKKLAKAIAAEPALQGRMSMSEHARAVELMRVPGGQRAEIERRFASPKVSDLLNGDASHHILVDAGNTPEQQQLAKTVRSQLESGAAMKFVKNPDAKPKNEAEAIIQTLVKERLAESPEQPTMFRDPASGIVIVMKSVPKGGVWSAATIDSHIAKDPAAFEAASTRVGAIVAQEYLNRVGDRVAQESMLWESQSQKVAEAAGVSTIKDLKLYPGQDGKGVIAKSQQASLYGRLTPEQSAAAMRVMKEQGLLSLSKGEHLSRKRSEIAEVEYNKLIAEVRSVGGVLNGTPPHDELVAQRGKLSTNAQAVLASSKYPTEWIEASNVAGGLSMVDGGTGRAHYSEDRTGGGTIRLSGDAAVAIHELAHRMEDVVPGLAQMETAFYERRTANSPLKNLNQIYPSAGYKGDERARPDEFFSAYVGKDYGSKRFYEVMSMGMQAVAKGDHGTNAPDRIDHDYAAFVFGALTVLLPGGST